MKRLLLAILILIYASTAYADVDISALPDLVTPATATDSVLTYDSSQAAGSRQTELKFDATATNCLTGTGTWVAFQAYNSNLTGINQALDNAADAVFSTLNATGANGLSVGTASTNNGNLNFKSSSNANYFDITASAFGANLTWLLPTAAPGGANYLLNVDSGTGQMGYTDPASLTGTGDLLANGTIPLTADWDVGAYTITGLSFASDVATGVAPPFVVASTDQVLNLNATTVAGYSFDQGVLTTSDVTFNSVTVAPSVNPGFTAKSSAAGDATIGTVYWDWTDSTGGINADMFLQSAQAGSIVTVLSFDESDDRLESTKGLTITGTLEGAVSVTVDTAATIDLTDSYGALGAMRINGDADVIDYTLPPAVAGLSVCFYSQYANVVTVDVDDGVDVITLDGTALTAGNAIDSAGGAGDFICLMAIDATNWLAMGKSGTWVDGGAD